VVSALSLVLAWIVKSDGCLLLNVLSGPRMYG
jgi:hypothetical protein